MSRTFEIRCALECLAGEKALEKISGLELKRLRELLRSLRKPVVRNDTDRKAHERDNSELHRTIVQASGNRRFLEMYGRPERAY
jgi:DNA-binding GntR family transcriptional regulator